MENTNGWSEGHGAEGRATSRMHLHTGNPDRGNDGSHLLDDLRVRAGEAADRAREVVGSRLRETRDLVEEHTGILAYSREHPTTALVGAFSTGFVLATI